MSLLASLVAAPLGLIRQRLPLPLYQRLSRASQFLWQPLTRGRELGELLSLAVAVCLAVVVAKGVLAHTVLANAAMPPQIVDGDGLASWARILASCAEDSAAVLGCLLAAGLAFRWG